METLARSESALPLVPAPLGTLPAAAPLGVLRPWEEPERDKRTRWRADMNLRNDAARAAESGSEVPEEGAARESAAPSRAALPVRYLVAAPLGYAEG